MMNHSGAIVREMSHKWSSHGNSVHECEAVMGIVYTSVREVKMGHKS